MNNLMLFEGNEVKIIIGENGEPLFELYSTGMALGHVKIAKGKPYPRKTRIDKCVKNAEISTVIHGDTTFINIEGLKKLISVSHTENKIYFINWLKENKFIEYDEVFITTRKEILFINELENALKPFNIKGEKQHRVLNYEIDYYIELLNVAIEYDENNHCNYSYEQHEGRQLEIEKELGCKFIRVTDYNTLGYNIGLVIKEIFNILSYDESYKQQEIPGQISFFDN